MGNILNIDCWASAHLPKEHFSPGLTRLSQFLAKEIVLSESCEVFTIAGTNGKGETAFFLAELLRRNPRGNFSLFTSPHVHSLKERFNLNGKEISEEECFSLFERVYARMQESQIPLTYFEFMFAAFLIWSLEKGVKQMVLEVGLGGRFDAVNVLKAPRILMSSISRDHQEFLGNSYRSILQDKLGVLHFEKKIFSCLPLRFCRQIVQKACVSQRASHWDVFTQNKAQIERQADYRFNNLCLARAAYHDFCLSGEALPEEEFWDLYYHFKTGRGRREFFQKNGTRIVLSGSHNSDGVRSLLKVFPCKQVSEALWSFSKRDEKDLTCILKIIDEYLDTKSSFAAFEHPKAFDSNKLRSLIDTRPWVSDHKKWISDRVGKQERLFLISGSYYFIAICRLYLKEQGFEKI